MKPLYRADVALFLDVDGTLLSFVGDPDDVEAGAELLGLLTSLHRSLDGALALVSGRSLASVDAIFHPLVLPAAGLHGLERRDARGRLHRAEPEPSALDSVRERFSRFVGAHPECLVEDKEVAIALHFRRAPSAAADARRLEAALSRELPDALQVQPGKMVLEVRPRGETKGSALAAFMSEKPFAGRTPVFVGDDVTDEDGFRFVAAHDGIGIKVGAGDSSASERLSDVAAVYRWLEDFRRALSKGE